MSIQQPSILAREHERTSGLLILISIFLTAFALTLSFLFPCSTLEISQGIALFQNLVWLLSALSISTARYLDAASFTDTVSRRLQAIAVSAAALIGMVALTTIVIGPPADFRAGVNALWQWIGSGVAGWTIFQLLLVSTDSVDRVKRMLLWLVIFSVTALAVHAVYQKLVSIPADLEAYKRNPDAVLRTADIDAPPGSAMRSLFESRLYDQAPTATYALANSLAAVLAPVLVLIAGLLLQSWNHRARSHFVVLTLIAILLSICLFWTKSRTAWLSCILGLAWLCIAHPRVKHLDTSKKFALAVSGLVSFGVLCGFVYWWDSLIIKESFKSLFFRATYWQATLSMLSDYPLSGIGTGNFQEFYTQYKPMLASESVSDPHSLWFETLAVGGPLAFVGLSVLAAITLWVAWRSPASAKQQQDVAVSTNDKPQTVLSKTVALLAGSMIAVSFAWNSFGLVGVAPDFAPYLFSVPILAVLAGYLFGGRRHEPVVFDRASLGASFFTILVCLSFVGGWMTPGVGNLVLILAACVWSNCVDDEKQSHHLPATAHRARLGLILAWLCLIGLFLWSAWLPVQSTKTMLGTITSQKTIPGTEQLQELIDADRWNPELWWQASAIEKQRLLQTVSGATTRLTDSSLENFRTFASGMVDRDQQNWSSWTQRGHMKFDLAPFHPVLLPGACSDYAAAVVRYPSDVEVQLQAALAHFLVGDYKAADSFLTQAEWIDQHTEHLDRKLSAGIVYWAPAFRMLIDYRDETDNSDAAGSAEAGRNRRLWELGREEIKRDGWIRAEPLARALRSLLP